MNAPSEAESPAICMRIVTPTTVSSAAAVIASLTRVSATRRSEVVEHEVPDDDDDGNEAEALQARRCSSIGVGRPWSTPTAANSGAKRDERDGRQILEQQHREAQAAVPRAADRRSPP